MSEPDDEAAALAMIFGSVAEDYDAYRPSYPDEVVDWVADRVRGRKAAEMGAGTGKATELFLAAGFEVTAVEPDPAMAAVGMRRAPTAIWRVVQAEDWDRQGSPFDLIYGAQSWHWVPEEDDDHIVEALRPAGILAWIWNRPAPGTHSQLFDDLYARYMDDPDASLRRRIHRRDDDYWIGRLEKVAGPVETFESVWAVTMSTPDYVSLTSTYSDHLSLPVPSRRELADAIARRLDDVGGRLEMNYVTKVYLAHRD